MKTKLINRPVRRVFTFGCSFTGYAWMCWPEAIAYDLNIPLYNYGRSGAGNQYIFNMLMQANNYYKFDENDLVIVSWTNVYRDDKFIKNNWVTLGNIYANDHFFTPEYINKYCDPEGFLIRDAALISAVDKTLDQSKCQYHFLSMNDFTDYYNQFSSDKFNHKDLSLKVKDLYKDSLEKILPSFYKVLWENNLSLKAKQETELFGGNFDDRHPHPQEHLDYLQTVFDHEFSEQTKQQIKKIQQDWFTLIDKQPKDKKIFTYLLDKDTFNLLRTITTLKASEVVFQL
jgi:hypothetical protein